VFYLSQPVENLPYDVYLEFAAAEQRAAEYEANSLKHAGLEAQAAALALLQSQGDGSGGIALIGAIAGEHALQGRCAKALDYQRDGIYKIYSDFAIPLCLGDYYDKFRVVGTTPAFFEQLKVLDEARKKELRFAQGRAFVEFNEEHGWYESVVGATVAREMNVKVGDVINPAHGDPAGHQHGQGFTVVGILAPTGTPHDRAVFVNMEGFFLMDGHAANLEKGEEEDDPIETRSVSEAKKEPTVKKSKWPEPLPIERREVTALLIRTSNILVTDSMVRSINKNRTLNAQAVLPIKEIFGLLNFIVSPIQALLLFLTAMICFVSGVSIMVGIYNSMSDRRRDIAVMRALGADRWTVFGVILFEAIILSLGGGLLGWLAGHTLNQLAGSTVENLTGVALRWWSLVPAEILLVPAMIALAVLAGLIPAMVAYRTDVSRSLAP
jgi:putative ABC transport system permease protein